MFILENFIVKKSYGKYHLNMRTSKYYNVLIDNSSSSVIISGISSTHSLSISFDSCNVFERVESAYILIKASSGFAASALFIIKNNTDLIPFRDNGSRRDIDTDVYLEFDVTHFLQEHYDLTQVEFNLSACFASITLYPIDSFLEVTYSNPFDYLNKQKLISKEIGAHYKFSQDIISYFPYIERDLFPDSLLVPCSLVYDSFNPQSEHFPLFPKGFKFNLLEKIIDATSESLTLVDSSFNYRKFKVTNDTTLFIDCGGSGDLIQHTGSTYKLFSPVSDSYKLFDGNGLITKIHLNSVDEINFAYSSDSISIIDSRNRSITISNSFNLLMITASNIPTQIYNLNTNSTDLLLSLAFFSLSGVSSIDSFTYANGILTEINTHDGYKASFSFNNLFNYSFSLFYGTTLLDGYSLNKANNRITLTNSINNTSYIYDFNDDHTIIVEGELTNTLNNNDLFAYMDSFVSCVAPRSEVAKRIPLLFSSQVNTGYDDHIDFTVSEENMGELSKKIYCKTNNDVPIGNYLIIAKITQNKGMPSKGKSFKRCLSLFNDHIISDEDVLAATPLVEFDNFGEQYFVQVIKMASSDPEVTSLPLKLTFALMENYGTFSLSNACLIKVEKSLSGIIYGNSVSSYQIATSIDNVYDDLIKSLTYENPYDNNRKCSITPIDLRMNQLSLIKEGYSRFFYVNQLKDIIVSFFPNDKLLHVNGDTYISFNSTSFGFVAEDKSNAIFLDIISSSALNNLSCYKIDTYRIRYASNHHCYLIYKVPENVVLEQLDYRGAITAYTYDSNYHHLLSTDKNANNLSSIKKSFTFDALNRLIGETEKVGNQSSTSIYSYENNIDLLHSIVDGNNNQIELSYSSRFEYLRVVSENSVPITTNRNSDFQINNISFTNGNFAFSYDTSRNELNKISFLSNDLLTIDRYYYANGSQNIQFTTANGFSYIQSFDKYHRLTSKVSGSSVMTFSYDSSYADGKLQQIYDGWGNEGETTTFSYDDSDRLNQYVTVGYISATRSINYDSHDRISSYREDVSGSSISNFDSTFVKNVYSYDAFTSEATSVTINVQKNILDMAIIVQHKGRDAYNRPTSLLTTYGTKSVGFNNISYFSLANNETSYEIASVTFKQGGVSSYTYDKVGNILSITTTNSNSQNVNYQYDSFYRLAKETHPSENYYIDYTYDTNGNILAAIKKDLTNNVIETNTFTYSSSYPNRLSQYNGSSISYDSYGNPLNVSGATLVYVKGHLLSSRVKSGTTTTYKYNGFGVRTYKKVGSILHRYVVEGGRINREVIEETISPYSKHYFIYLYGLNGIIGFVYDGDKYLYEKDLQNNIIAIYKKTTLSISLKARYIYDAYGNHQVLNPDGTVNTSVSFIGHLNPFRYRSYYYDEDSGFYYCQSRYYVPYLRRWLTPDDLSYLDNQDIFGCNLYLYCYDNPVMYSDKNGTFPVVSVILGITALVGIGLTIGGVISNNNIVTAVGLIIVGVAALSSGGIAVAGAIETGAILSGIVGANTMLAGVGSLTFASAEIQESFGKDNWIMETTNISESVYNQLLIGTAFAAAIGTILSSVTNAFEIRSIKKIDQFGKYYGMQFIKGDGSTRVLSFHTHSHDSSGILGWHWQLSKYNPVTGKTSGTIARWLWWALWRI